MDKSLFFMVLSITCIWLIVDAAVGKGYVNNFLASIFPFMLEEEKEPLTEEEVETKIENAPSSAAISGATSNKAGAIAHPKNGSNSSQSKKENNSGSSINSVPYAPMQQMQGEELKKILDKWR